MMFYYKTLATAFIIVTSLLGFSYFNASPTPIRWKPEKIETSVFRGGIRTFVVNFVSDHDIVNVDLFVTPNLRSVVKVSTTTQFNVFKGESSLELVIMTPKGTKVKKIEGTIHIRDGNRTISMPLEIGIKVLDTQNVEQKISESLMQEFGTTTPFIPDGTRFLLSSTSPEIEFLLSAGTNMPSIFRLSSVVFDYNLPISAELGVSIAPLLNITATKGIRVADIANSLTPHLWHIDNPNDPLISPKDHAITMYV